jgi:acyl-CoA thioesterase-1
MKKKETFCLAIMLLIFVSFSKREIKVACVGNSITEGYGLANQSKTAFPVILESILGSDYSVLNFGRSGATAQKKSDNTYWTCNQFSNVFAFNPDIIILKLGTNDVRPRMDGKAGTNWNAENFSKDYQAMIDTFKIIPSKPQIYLCLPTPISKTNAFNWNDGDSSLRACVIPAIKKIGAVNKLPVIDLYTHMSNQPENFPDGIHPNEKGAKIIAEFIAKAIQGKN